jgi:hypothetical protein
MQQDKGQAHMIGQFLDAVKTGAEPIIHPNESFIVMEACFAIEESLRTRDVVSLSWTDSPLHAGTDESESREATAPAMAEAVADGAVR